jgi:hypothetical protein
MHVHGCAYVRASKQHCTFVSLHPLSAQPIHHWSHGCHSLSQACLFCDQHSSGVTISALPSLCLGQVLDADCTAVAVQTWLCPVCRGPSGWVLGPTVQRFTWQVCDMDVDVENSRLD